MEHTGFLYWTALHPELYHITSPYGRLCGYWTNGAYSPDLFIFRKNRGYWIAVIYPSGEFYVSRIVKVFQSTIVNLFEKAYLGYNVESDLLFLSSEGCYHRKKEWEECFSYSCLETSYKQIQLAQLNRIVK